MRCAFAIALVAFSAGCARADPPARRASAADDEACAIALEIAPIAHQLALHRGHTLSRRIDVRVLADAEYDRERGKLVDAPTQEERIARAAYRVFFGVHDPPYDTTRLSAGFYDPKQKTMFVRFHAGDPDTLRTTLAHELEHAVQDEMGASICALLGANTVPTR